MKKRSITRIITVLLVCLLLSCGLTAFAAEEGSTDTPASAMPKKLDKTLCDQLWNKGVPVILTSGTLSVRGDFSRTSVSLGLSGVAPFRRRQIAVESPFDYLSNVLMYISENMPYPDNRSAAYLKAVAKEVKSLILATHGHTAVLFTSYRAMEKVMRLIEADGIPYPMFSLSRGSTGAIEQFRKSGNGVLFASGALWEGIDLPGDILSSLIIVKLPFAVPDPVTNREAGYYKTRVEFMEQVIVPDMLIKLLQGFGRLIRTETDTGVVSILDSRVAIGGKYRDIVLRALPRCRVTEKLERVISFIHAIKPLNYFSYSAKGGLPDYGV